MSKQHTLKDLELPDDEPMVVIRSSFLWICDGDKYAAAALNMYVHWTKWLMKHRPVAQEINNVLKKQGKKPTQDTSLILYRKQKDLITDLLGFCNEKRLREANVFLESKGLLKISNAARSNLDHVLKYELQIDIFKDCMEKWRKHRDENESKTEENTLEGAPSAASTEADKSPSRSGQKSVSKELTEADKSPSRSGQKSVSINRYKKRDDHQIDDQKRKVRGSQSSTSRKRKSPSLSSQSSSQKSFSFEVPPKAEIVLDWWDEIQGYEGPRTEREIKTALEMARLKLAKEDIVSIKDFILANNGEWYKQQGIDIHAILTYYPKWKSAQGLKNHKASTPPQAPTSKTGTALPLSSYDDDEFEDDTFYSVREVKTREEAHATR